MYIHPERMIGHIKAEIMYRAQSNTTKKTECKGNHGEETTSNDGRNGIVGKEVEQKGMFLLRSRCHHYGDDLIVDCEAPSQFTTP